MDLYIVQKERNVFEIVLLSLVRSVAATKLTTMAGFTD